MRAGNLDRHIVIEEPCVTLDEYRTAIKEWRKLTAVRAQMLEHNTSDRKTVRATTDDSVTFRIYWLRGLSLEHRVIYQGHPYRITRIKETGRRAGLDISCERAEP